MVKVHFTQALQRFYPDLQVLHLEAQTLSEILKILDQKFPGLSSYLVDEQGALRQHVNIFLDDRMIDDRTTLTDPLESVEELYIMQALSGG